MNKFLFLLAGVALAAFTIAFMLHGKAQRKLGAASCVAQNIAVAAQESAKATKNLEKIQNETAKIPDSGLDDELSQLGIMRAPSDY